VPKLHSGSVTACVLGAFLAYLLSAGPMMRLTERYYWIITPETFDTIYAPIGLLMSVPGFEKGMMWYLNLWEPHEVSDMSGTAPAAPAAKAKPPAKSKKSAKP
jgi:hypothetical protein